MRTICRCGENAILQGDCILGPRESICMLHCKRNSSPMLRSGRQKCRRPWTATSETVNARGLWFIEKAKYVRGSLRWGSDYWTTRTPSIHLHWSEARSYFTHVLTKKPCHEFRLRSECLELNLSLMEANRSSYNANRGMSRIDMVYHQSTGSCVGDIHRRLKKQISAFVGLSWQVL